MTENRQVPKLPHQHRHHDRKDLAGEHPFGDLGQLILVILFSMIWILDSFVLKWSIWLNDLIPWYLRMVIAVPILIFAGYLAQRSLRTVFGEVRDPPRVINTGLYAHCRHPMYLASILLYIGLFLSSLSIIALGVCITGIIFYNYIAKFEEHKLEMIYGQEYIDYKAKVPRWWFKL